MHDLITLILAAGKGTRMKSDLPKVLHKVNGRPMVHYVIDLAREVGSSRILLIIGHKRELVQEACRRLPVEFAIQEQQLGTAHAVAVCEPMLRDYEGDVLILSGDVPLLRSQTIQKLINLHRSSQATATLLTAELDDPTGYGRIVRNDQGYVIRIVEHKDADEQVRAIKEINVGIYLFQAEPLFQALKQVKNDNAQNEYYLPDVIPILLAQGLKVSALKANDFNETRGINTLEELSAAETILLARSKS